jgi:energy-coupling factor transport system permease protein
LYRLTSSFIFEKRETFLHSTDPRVKLFMVMAFFIASLISSSLPLQIVLLELEALLAISAKSSRRWLYSLYAVAPFFALILVVNYLVSRDLLGAILPSIRLLSLVGVFSLFFLSTPPDLFALMLSKLGFPQMISLAFSMALRFIPVLAQQVQDIVDAQKSRGLSLDLRNPLKRVRSLIPILIPVIVLSIKRSIEIAEALEARAFNLSKKRTSFLELRVRRRDVVFFTLNVAFLILFLYVNSLV